MKLQHNDMSYWEFRITTLLATIIAGFFNHWHIVGLFFFAVCWIFYKPLTDGWNAYSRWVDRKLIDPLFKKLFGDGKDDDKI